MQFCFGASTEFLINLYYIKCLPMPIFQETLSRPHPKLLEVLGRIDSENLKTRDNSQSTSKILVYLFPTVHSFYPGRNGIAMDRWIPG